MAAAKATISIPDQRSTWVAGNKYFVRGTITIDANPATYTAGGILMSLLASLVKASRTPVAVSVSGLTGYIFKYVKGTDASNGLLKIFVQDAVATNPLLEMADALPIPAAVSGDTIGFEATFNGML
jgi:hypothetical protein